MQGVRVGVGGGGSGRWRGGGGGQAGAEDCRDPTSRKPS